MLSSAPTYGMVGVNLGGWLVLEKWMTPSVFKGTSARNEYQLSKSEEGRERIARHRKDFITKNDLVWLRKQNVELLRVPIGYWAIEKDTPYVYAGDRLDWLLRTSLSLGFKVMLDLHAAPGAQNPHDHSGGGNEVSKVHSTKWLNNKIAQTETIAVLCKLAERYHHFPHIWGIQLLNEPSVDLLGFKLARFYRKAYREITKVARPGTYIVFSDGYAPLRVSNCFWLMTKPNFPVAMDCHVYQAFDRSGVQPLEARLRKLVYVSWVLKFLSLQQPIVIGEWSGVVPEKTNSNATRRYIARQQKIYNTHLAHCYWSYKTEASGRWNYRDMRTKELIQ